MKGRLARAGRHFSIIARPACRHIGGLENRTDSRQESKENRFRPQDLLNLVARCRKSLGAVPQVRWRRCHWLSERLLPEPKPATQPAAGYRVALQRTPGSRSPFPAVAARLRRRRIHNETRAAARRICRIVKVHRSGSDQTPRTLLFHSSRTSRSYGFLL
jgi:hypothetical protein